MKTKFTKGKWRYSAEHNLITVSRIGIVEGSKTICDINERVNFGDNKGEVEANAKLISKAPELFETVIELQKRLESLINATPLGEERNKMTEENIIALTLINSIVE